jgi:conjugal transfer ATP-binding protein TraC
MESGISIRAWNSILDKGESFLKFLPYVAYDEKNEVYILTDNQGESVSLGAMFEINLLPGEMIDSAEEENLARTIETIYTSGSFPEGSSLQFCVYSSPSIDDVVENWYTRKINGNELFKIYADKRKEKFLQNSRLRRFRGFVTIRQFYKSKPAEEQIEHFRTNIESIKATMAGISWGGIDLKPRIFPPDQLISLITEILNGERIKNISYKDQYPIREQIQYKYISLRQHYTDVSGKVLKVCGVNFPPDQPAIRNAIKLLGDVYKEELQLTVPFLLTFNTTILDQYAKKAEIDKRHARTQFQAGGLLSKFSATLRHMAPALQFATEKAVRGKEFIRYSLHFNIFADDEREAKRETQQALNLLRLSGFTPFEESTIRTTIFLHSLPLCWDQKLDKFLQRQRTIMSDNIASITPLFADWKGTDTPVMMYYTRRGEILYFDFFDGPRNYNALIAAVSGAGKSFLVNDIITNYLAEGALVFVLDVGRSYQKLCEFLSGDYIEFAEDSPFNISPFLQSREKNGDMHPEDLAFVLPVVCKMAGVESQDEMGDLEEAIQEVFSKKLQSTTMTDLYDYLKKHKTTERLSKRLFSYSERGRFGTFFHKGKPLTFKNELSVLELEGLRDKKELQSVVLLLTMFHVNRNIEQADKGRRKILPIDEAWDLLADPFSAKFMENAYRIYRKYGASALAITQSLNDLYKNPSGVAIMENADFWLLLSQKPETLEYIVDSGRIHLSKEHIDLLRTVKTVPGKYSEIFFYTPIGKGIGRFSPDPFSYWMYTTKPSDVQAINDYMKKGLSRLEALKKLADENPEGK